MIEIKNLKKYFPIKSGFFNSKSGDVKAVESVTFDIPEKFEMPTWYLDLKIPLVQTRYQMSDISDSTLKLITI